MLPYTELQNDKSLFANGQHKDKKSSLLITVSIKKLKCTHMEVTLNTITYGKKVTQVKKSTYHIGGS